MPRRLRISKLKALTMVAAAGSYAWAGVSANLVRQRHLVMNALSGVFQWSGFNANLTKQANLVAPAVIGGNLSGYEYYSTQNALINMMQQSFAVNERDWQTPSNATLLADVNGDPPADFQCTPHWVWDTATQQDALGQCTGWVDSITTDNARVTIVSKVYTSSTNTTTFTVRYAAATGAEPNTHLIFTGTRRTGGSTGTTNTGVADLKIAHPGYTIADIATKVWTDEYVTYLRLLNGPLRTMDMQKINHSTNVNWTDVRRRATHKIGGPTYEDIAALANRTQRDLHMQIPHRFTDAAIDSFADFFEANVSQSQKILLGFSNEHTFTVTFAQFHDLLALTCVEVKGFVGGETAATNNLGLDRSWTASRTSNVATVTTGSPHLLATNQTVYFNNFDGATISPQITVTGANTFTFPNTGANNTGITANSGTWFVGELNTTLRLGSTIAADSCVNIYQLKVRYAMRRTKEISDRVRGRVGDAKMHARWFITWEDQMYGNGGDEQFGDPPLRYLEAKWTARPVNQYVSGLFGAPYFFADPLVNVSGATQSQLANQLVINCGNAKTDYKFEERVAVADYYGLVLGASWYEGGPDVRSSTLTGADLAVRCAVQFDPLMGTAYTTMLGEFFALGGKIANQYTFGFLKPTDENRDAVWGVTDSMTNLTTPKLTAITSTIASGAQVIRNVVPGTIDARLFVNQFTATTYPNLTVPHRRFTINAKQAGTYRIRIRYTCNFGGNSANVIIGSTTVSGGPFTFTNQGTGVAHATLRSSPGPIALPDMFVTLKQGASGLDVVRTASMGDDVQLYDIDVATVKTLAASPGSFTMTGNSFAGSTGSVSAQDVTTVSVEGTGTQFVTFGHAFKQGDVPSGSSAVLTNGSNTPIAAQQTNILATWPDGSAKHAVIAASVTGGSTYKVRSAAPITGTALTTAGLLAAISGNIATVALSGGVTGTSILRDLISSASGRAAGGLKILEQGPTMLGLTVSQDFSTHVRVTFHLRWYGGTNLWCDFIFENGYGNLNSQADKGYTAVLDLNGTTVLNTGAITHYNHTMWHRAAWSSGGTLYVHHNVAYLRDSVKAVPYYDPAVAPDNTLLNALPTARPAPMQRVSNYPRGDGVAATWTAPWDTADIEEPGYQETIGILPRWDALYVSSGGDSRAFNSMLALHDGCMCAPVSFLSSTDGDHMRVSDFPSATIAADAGFGTGAFTTANPVGAHRSGWPASHSPSVGFTPYLLTGQYAYLRALHAWAHEHAIWASSNRNFTFNGATVRQWYKDQKRGWAWTYRTVAQAHWVTPNNHSAKTYLSNSLEGNFSIDNTDYVSPGTQASNRGGGVIGFTYDWDWEQNGIGWYSGFMHAFQVQAMGYIALDLGYTNALNFTKYCAKFIAGIMGCGTTFPSEFAPSYSFHPGATQASYYSSWASFKADTANLSAAAASLDPGTSQMASAAQAVGTNHTGRLNETVGDQGSATYYWANYLPAVSYLEALDIEGGWVAWYKMRLAGTPMRDPTTFAKVPQFGIAKRPKPRAAYIEALPLLQWNRLANTAPSSVDPASNLIAGGSTAGKIDAWTSAVHKIKGADYIIPAQGGHADYSGNEVIGIQLNATTPSWRTIKAITPLAQQTSCAAHYADGAPSSRHGYHNPCFAQGSNKIILHGAYAGWCPSATGFDFVDTYDMASGTWSFVSGAANIGQNAKACGMSLTTDFVYYIPTGSGIFSVYRPLQNTTTQLNGAAENTEDYRSGAIDPKRGVFLSGPGTGSQTSGWTSYSISTGAMASRSSTINQGGSAGGLEWDPDGDRYLFWNGGNTIWAIDPVSFAKTAITTTGTAPSTTAAGCFKKFRYLPEIGCVAMVDAIGNNLAICRLR